MVETAPPMELDPLLAASDGLSELFECDLSNSFTADSEANDRITMKTRLSSVTDKLTFAHLRWLLIRLTLISAVTSAIFSTSVLIYFIFYQIYVPVVHQQIPVYFQFDASRPPTAIIDSSKLLFMRSGVAYDFILDIDLPDIPGLSQNVGNFMASLELYTKGKSEPWLIRSRPTLIPYRSSMARFVSSTLKILPVLFGWCDERISQRIFLAQATKSPNEAISLLKIALSVREIPVYEASLLITAHFTGLRYLMYHWKITCAVAVIFVLFMAQLAAVATLMLIYYIIRQRSKVMLQASIPHETCSKISLPLRRGRSRSRSSIKYRSISGSRNGVRKRRPFSLERNDKVLQ